MPERKVALAPGEKEKREAAVASVTAAVLLTLLKLGVGFGTNSLGVLSEAAHSALDLMAAGMTYMAVRMAAFPPDTGHPYGHGKIENLSALVEALLLIVTCIWITREAIDRLFFNPAVVRPSVWAVLVMVVSIVVDHTRSRMLRRVAKKHRSQALEADALHFSTDMLSSAVVLAGLAGLYLAEVFPESGAAPWLQRADSLAALGVSCIVLRVSWMLGARAVNVLLDAGDAALAGKLRAALRGLAGIRKIESLRLRRSGPDLFVDLALCVDRATVLEETAHIRNMVEEAVRGVENHALVSVVLLPYEAEEGDRIARVRGLAAAHGLTVHGIEVVELEDAEGGDRVLVEMHAEFHPETTLAEAYAKVGDFEAAFTATRPDVVMVTHIEPLGEMGRQRVCSPEDSREIMRRVARAVARNPGVHDAHNLLVRTFGGGRYVSFHCLMDPRISVEEAHTAATKLQKSLYGTLPGVDRVTVQVEPLPDPGKTGAEGARQPEDFGRPIRAV